MYFLFGNNVYGDTMIYILLMFADMIWGLNIIVTKLNYPYFHPVFLVFLKFLFSFLAMIVIIYIRHERFEKISVSEVFINSNLINVINFLLTYYALLFLRGTASASMNCLSPFIMTLITCFHERTFNKVILYLSFLSVLGFFCTIAFQISSFSYGHLLFLFALWIYNFGNFRLQKIRHASIFIYNACMLLIALIETGIICLFCGQLVYNSHSFYLWLFILTSGAGYAYIQCVYFYAIRKIGPLSTSLFIGLTPALTYLFSVLFLKESVSFSMICGFLIVFFSSLCLLKYQHCSREKNKSLSQ